VRPLLLDTHTLIWLAGYPERLSETAKGLILDSSSILSVSMASAWEVAIKISIGRLAIEGGVAEFFRIAETNGIPILPIRQSHVERVQRLPLLHRDPFDRLLIASALEEDMAVVTTDEGIGLYPIDVVW
jgi:PIN domain nuclease of toxin-antitoxin system